MAKIKITYVFTKKAPVASLTIESEYVPRTGEFVHLKSFEVYTADEPLTYRGIVESVDWLILPWETTVTVTLD